MKTRTLTNYHLSKRRECGKGHQITGAVIAMVGLFWLAKKVGWIPAATGGSAIFWPVVIVIAGIAIFLSSRSNRKSDVMSNFPTNTEHHGQ